MANFFDEFETEADALENHRAKSNPPEFGAGQDDDWFTGLKSEGPSMEVDSFSGFNSPAFGGGAMPPGGGGPEDPNRSKEEVILGHIWKGFVSFCKVIGNFLATLFQTIKITSPIGWNNTFVMFSRYGFGLSAFGLFLYILGFFISSISYAMWLVVLGILCGVVGLSGRFLIIGKASAWAEENNSVATTTDEIGSKPADFSQEPIQYEDDYSEEVVENLYPDPSSFEDDSFGNDSFGGEGFDNIEYEDEQFVSLADVAEEGFTVLDVEEPENVDDAIKELDMALPGVQSRLYLHEQFSKILRSITPNFHDMVEIYEDTEVFSHYNFLLSNAASREGFNDEDYRLLKIYENSFMYKLVVAANGKFKADKVGQSIENQERFNDMGREVAPNVMVMTKVIGGNVHIDILKNKPPKFSVKDVWSSDVDYIRNTDISMPVALGSDEMGEPIFLDFYNVDGVALSGMKGTGKSWLAQSIISQLAMFNDPNKVQFIIADPKGEQGDFNAMNFPHIIKKVQSNEDTMAVLRWLMNEEVPRRRALMGQYNMSNIKELHKLHPDVNMPFLYIVIEEMMSLGNHLQKNNLDDYKEYRMILSEIINNLRYVGVRLFGLTQRLVDSAIPKDAKVGIDLRMTAGADASEIEQVTETKQKDFPYNISGKVGRYAIRTPEYRGGKTSFMIGAVLGNDSIDNGNTFRYIEALWNKLEPRKEVLGVEEAVAKEIEGASPSEMDDILNMVIDI